MRKILLFALFVPVFFSCKEKDLSDNNPAPSTDNVVLQTSFIYGEDGIHYDSLYSNELGLQFYFSEVSVVFSNFVFTENSDTTLWLKEPALFSPSENQRLIGKLEPGGYAGKYSLRLGLDSLEGFNFSSGMAEDEPLKNSSVFRQDKQGIDQLIIKGRLLDPMNIFDSIGTIPFEYRVGTYLTSKIYISDNQNFNVSGNAKIPFIVQINLLPILDEFDMYTTRTIISDRNKWPDMAVALEMADSLQIGLF